MEKKLLLNGEQHAVLPYTPVHFDSEHLPGGPALSEEAVEAREEITEEDILARVKTMEEQGYEKGYSSGYEKGVVAGGQEVADKLERIGKIISELEAYKRKVVHELLPGITDLSLEIAKRVIHKEIELDKDIITFVVEDAIKKVGENEESITIKVNPLDYEVMLSHIALLKEQSGLKDVTVEPLATISPGGCYIETPTGEIDARIEEQVKEVQDAISTATDREM